MRAVKEYCNLGIGSTDVTLRVLEEEEAGTWWQAHGEEEEVVVGMEEEGEGEEVVVAGEGRVEEEGRNE